jgi:hypothetical protein
LRLNAAARNQFDYKHRGIDRLASDTEWLRTCNLFRRPTDVENMKHRLILFLIAVNLGALASDEIAILGIAQLTRNSTGYGYGTFQVQSSPASLGVGAEYRHWWSDEKRWRNQGIYVSYNVANSGAKFTSPFGVVAFGLKRHEFDVGYIHRFRSDYTIVPFVKAGAGGFITNGGMAPGGVVGIDGQFAMVGEVGADTWLNRHLGLTCGLSTRWFRAPYFSDSGYHGARTEILEPRIGVTWRF